MVRDKPYDPPTTCSSKVLKLERWEQYKIDITPIVTMGVFNPTLWIRIGGIMNNTKKTDSKKDYDNIFVQIKSKDDEAKWKDFLSYYFPNHYASTLLNEDLVIDIEAYCKGNGYINKSIAVSPSGYGYITLRFANFGGYEEVDNFEVFKLTNCYKTIVNQGKKFEVGMPTVIHI